MLYRKISLFSNNWTHVDRIEFITVAKCQPKNICDPYLRRKLSLSFSASVRKIMLQSFSVKMPMQETTLCFHANCLRLRIPQERIRVRIWM